MEDALVSFTKTGKLDFTAMADSIISDLIRIAIQQSVTRPLAQAMGLFSFADGGIMSSAGKVPVNAYASGGIANSPQLALFGEGRMNEAFVPLPDGKSIPVSLQGGGGGAVTINQPLVINAPNAGPETIGQIRSLMPGFLAENKRVIEAVIQQAMARRGGRFA
jgi:phage-related minor tail protein